MSDRRQLVDINQKTATKWWETPIYFLNSKTIKQNRLKRILEHDILPILQNIEKYYIQQNLNIKPRIYGKSFTEVIRDDVAIEAAVYLFDLAVNEGLITFGEQQERKNEISQDIPVGSCGRSISQVKKRYVKRATYLIVKKTGASNAVLKNILIDDISDLNKIRTFSKFGIANIRELNTGLNNDLKPLLARDKEYLDALYRCCEMKYLRAVHHALGNDFSKILEWQAPFIRSIADDLSHKAQIIALGNSLNQQPASDVMSALGRWQMEEMPHSETGDIELIDIKKTRIGQIKNLLSEDFDKILSWHGSTLDVFGNWPNHDIILLKPYIKYIDRNAMSFLSVLPSDNVIAIIEGLWIKAGKMFFKNYINTRDGENIIKKICKSVVGMNKRKSTPNNLKAAIIDSGIFDDHVKIYTDSSLFKNK